MLPFGPRLTTVFASRWKALFWAASVMVSAYFTASAAKHDRTAQDDTAMKAAAALIAQPTPSASASPASPWAK